MSRRLGLKGVLIDFYWTIAYCDKDDGKLHREEIVKVLGRAGCATSYDEVSSVSDNTSRGATRGEIKDMHEFWRTFLRNLGISDQPALVQELKELRDRHLTKGIKLYDGTLRVLSDLKKKYRLALVSNCSVGLSEVIDAHGLTPFFDSIVLSYNAGVRKPEGRIYLKALEELELGPEACIFVADEISDLEGASEVGLRTLLVRQGDYIYRDAKDPAFKPDFQCDNISEITDFI